MSARVLLMVFALLGLAGCVTAPPPSAWRAPVPTRAVDMDRLWSGRWLEIARPQMSLTDGCVAGASNYTAVSPTRVDVRDTCEVGVPGGREKAVSGRGEILDPGTNARLRVRYFGGFVTWDYWILDYADDYSWFISADPTFEKAWIYTREAPDAQTLAALVERLRALGYDMSRLEFPAVR